MEYDSETGWAVHEGRWEEGEGTLISFTLAAFGLRISLFFEGVREVFLWRVSQKQSQTSMSRGTQWMSELTGAETVAGAAGADMQGTYRGKKVEVKEHCRRGKLV